MRCADCEQCIDKPACDDPREPPLQVGECLCSECGIAAYRERIDELEAELDDLKSMLEKLEERQ